MKSKSNKIGSLWVNEKNGKKYLTGNVNGEKIVIFPNGFKESDKHPDYVIYASHVSSPQDIKKQEEAFVSRQEVAHQSGDDFEDIKF